MKAMERLLTHVRERPLELRRQKEKGVKIVGYIPSHVPEELLYASGAMPAGLICGGSHEAVVAGESCLDRFIDTFARSQIGYRLLGEKLVYQLPDLLIVPLTDRNIQAIADSWEMHTDVEVFKLGIPRYTNVRHGLEYYLAGLRSLKQRLQKLTGIEIKDERLRDEKSSASRRDLPAGGTVER